jgi:hypothetical protein
MRYDDFINELVSSDIEDWIYDDDLGLYIYKNNITISIESDRNDLDDREFYEDWVEKFPDPKGYRARFFLKYNGNIVESFYTVAVDGYRMLIPYPKSIKNMIITNKQYKIGRIINIPYSGYGFEDYLKRAGIDIVSSI